MPDDRNEFDAAMLRMLRNWDKGRVTKWPSKAIPWETGNGLCNDGLATRCAGDFLTFTAAGLKTAEEVYKRTRRTRATQDARKPQEEPNG